MPLHGALSVSHFAWACIRILKGPHAVIAANFEGMPKDLDKQWTAAVISLSENSRKDYVVWCVQPLPVRLLPLRNLTRNPLF